jgi:hypothetical protein
MGLEHPEEVAALWKQPLKPGKHSFMPLGDLAAGPLEQPRIGSNKRHGRSASWRPLRGA